MPAKNTKQIKGWICIACAIVGGLVGCKLASGPGDTIGQAFANGFGAGMGGLLVGFIVGAQIIRLIPGESNSEKKDEADPPASESK